jgi:hypothetical protein
MVAQSGPGSSYKRTVVTVWTLEGSALCPPKKLIVMQELTGHDNERGQFEWDDPPGSIAAIDGDTLQVLLDVLSSIGR